MDLSGLAALALVGGLAGVGTIIGVLASLHSKHIAVLKDSVESLRSNSVVEAQKVIAALQEFHKTELEVMRREHEQRLFQERKEFESDRAKLWAEFKAVEAELKKTNDPQNESVLRRLTVSGKQVFGKTRTYPAKWSGLE